MGTERIERCFARLKQERRSALVAYLCIGDPSVETSEACVRAALAAGADVIELGVPFSDPTADGAVIAAASFRAIQQGGSLRATLEVARALRPHTEAPLVLFSYYNPIFTYGDVPLIDAAAEAGIDALLVVDLPPEEGAELRARAKQRGLSIVPLLAPTSDAERETRAVALASGFIYYVSITGVTGAATISAREAAEAASGIRARSRLPVVVGFGIDSPEKARAIIEHGVDGVVVGTALVKAVAAGKSPSESAANVRSFVQALRSGLDGA